MTETETEALTETEIDTVTRHYVVALLWSSLLYLTEGSDPVEADRYEASDTLTEASRADVVDFIGSNRDDVAAYVDALSLEQLGHDFALTRNGHGAGFWDRGLGALGDRLSDASKPYGETDLYLDDDGTVSIG